MKIRNLIASLFIIPATFISFTTISFAVEPQNLDIVKDRLIQYHDSGEYLKDQTKVVHLAIEYLKARLQHPRKKPLAIVLDIDETSLSNYRDMLEMSFGGTLEEIDKAEDKGTDEVISPTLELYKFAKKHNIAVFFVTGRRENSQKPTMSNLESAGYMHWDGLYLKPQNYHQKSAAPYKINARMHIESKGYDIALNIGDQQSDLSGGHADKTFKMPNPYYRIP